MVEFLETWSDFQRIKTRLSSSFSSLRMLESRHFQYRNMPDSRDLKLVHIYLDLYILVSFLCIYVYWERIVHKTRRYVSENCVYFITFWHLRNLFEIKLLWIEVLGNNFRGSLEILEFSFLTDEIWSRLNVRGWF